MNSAPSRPRPQFCLNRNHAVGQASRLSLTSKNSRLSGYDSRPELNHRVADLLEDGDRRDACPTLPSQQSELLFYCMVPAENAGNEDDLIPQILFNPRQFV
jgi:hypothetical protein